MGSAQLQRWRRCAGGRRQNFPGCCHQALSTNVHLIHKQDDTLQIPLKKKKDLRRLAYEAIPHLHIATGVVTKSPDINAEGIQWIYPFSLSLFVNRRNQVEE